MLIPTGNTQRQGLQQLMKISRGAFLALTAARAMAMAQQGAMGNGHEGMCIYIWYMYVLYRYRYIYIYIHNYIHTYHYKDHWPYQKDKTWEKISYCRISYQTMLIVYGTISHRIPSTSPINPNQLCDFRNWPRPEFAHKNLGWKNCTWESHFEYTLW